MSLPSVVQAYAEKDYTIVAQFDDGKIVRYSIKPLIDTGGVFASLKDYNFFSRHITVLNGTVAWSRDFDPRNCIDLDPLVVYSRGQGLPGDSDSR